jgi:hypothetical protein
VVIDLVKAFEGRQKESIRGRSGRVLHRESFLHDASVIIYIFSFNLKEVRCGPHIWIVHQLIWEQKVLLVKR